MSQDPNPLSPASRKVLLVNGTPASGKTTIAESLVETLHIPLISLDRIKVALFDTLGIGDREYNRTLGRASMAIIWSLLLDTPRQSTTIVEAWFKFPPFDPIIQSLAQAGVTRYAEVWCYATPDVLAQRYTDRVGLRHPGHPGVEYVSELRQVALRAAPMSIGPVLSVDTTDPTQVDLPAIAHWVAETLEL
ncbi:MAG: ATP-binding protein [Chloroflexi bacterium]|nr:AAA family ATPase [Anaerolineaceae bacterium]NMB86758.1 ATP-binding protein [Chloroflexota bacterium]